MSDLFWLSDAQMSRLEPYFPKSHGKPRVDDRRVLSGIIFINRNGLRWRDAPREYGPHKTLCNRWKRWSDKGVFARIMAGLAAEHGEETTVMIDATHLKAHRTASSLGVKKGGAWTPYWPNQGRHEHEAARHLRQMSNVAPLVRATMANAGPSTCS
jgi:transposase